MEGREGIIEIYLKGETASCETLLSFFFLGFVGCINSNDEHVGPTLPPIQLATT